MNRLNSVKKNFLLQLTYQIVQIIIPLITSPYVSRILGAEAIGTFTYTYTIVYYFVMVSMLGINTYGNKLIAESRGSKEELNRQFSSLATLHTIISIILLISYYIFVFSFTNENREFYLIQSVWIITSVIDYGWVFFGIEDIQKIVIKNIIVRVICVILIFILVRSPEDLVIYAIINAGCQFLGAVWILVNLKKFVQLSKFSCTELLKHIKPLIVLAIPVIAMTLYQSMDKLMLGNMMDTKSELGYYENAEKIINICFTIITALGTVMLARITNLYSNNKKDEIKNYLAASILFVNIVSFAIIFGLFSIAEDFAPWFFGAEFFKSGIFIKYLAITFIFKGWTNVYRTQYLIPLANNKLIVLSVIVGMIVNFVINLSLIPLCGAVGACIGTIVTEITVCIIQCISLSKDLNIKNYIKSGIPFLIFGLIMFFVIDNLFASIHSVIIVMLLKLVTGGMIYLGLSTFYILIFREDIIQLFKKIS